jgi:hypothetical protein
VRFTGCQKTKHWVGILSKFLPHAWTRPENAREAGGDRILH